MTETRIQLRRPANDTREAGTDVVLAVARRTGTDPLELPTLARYVDVDALERLVQTGSDRSGQVTVTFDYAGHTVTVDQRGDVRVS